MADANASDFFGDGVTSGLAKPKRDWITNPPQTNAELQTYLQEVQGDLYVAPATDATPGTAEQRAQHAYEAGNVGGAGGAYNSVSDAGRTIFDQNHKNTGNWAQRYADNSGIDLNPFNNGGAPPNLRNESPPVDAVTPAPAIGATPTPTMPTSPIPANGRPGTGEAGASGGGASAPGTPAAPAAPAAGTSDAVSGLLGGVNTYRSDIYNLSKSTAGMSVAEAQLQKSQELARIQAGINTQDSQRSALGMARSGRNRGDRALLERQAIGEAGFIGTKAASDAALVQAEDRGALSILRATESQADKDFKLKALTAAGELGLNQTALEIDLKKVNIADATERMKVALGYAQLDETKAQNILAFTRDMASIQFKYDELTVTDQNEADRLLMTKYGIDEGTMLALKKIKADDKANWDNMMMKFIGGMGTGATAAIASDERVKTNVQEVKATAAEFDDFMQAVTANTYEYKEPEKHGEGLRFGLMAQDLEKTKLGRHMVRPVDGVKMVEIAPLALATASGLSLVHQRLKELEQSLRLKSTKPDKGQKVARS
jgi:hypothetical protein